MAAEVVDRLVDESGESSQFKEVAVASVKGGAKILSSLEKAGENIYDSTSTSVSGVVKHKYGEKAGDVTKKGFCIGRDVVETVSSVRGIVRKTAGKTASKVAKKKSERRKKRLEGSEQQKDEVIEDGEEVNDEEEGEEEDDHHQQSATVTDIDSEEEESKEIEEAKDKTGLSVNNVNGELKQTDSLSLQTK
eukprot:TRINITY_DN8088_c0_g3_i2.p1 TRINITY_DN8088_c0_g3~~TRINITY_DN8088_c0_g3_i2.p1  ORF type:complete len:191 (-),score=66.11 TRINITY_DN8088_c0_g3_i2:16-588(-)